MNLNSYTDAQLNAELKRRKKIQDNPPPADIAAMEQECYDTESWKPEYFYFWVDDEITENDREYILDNCKSRCCFLTKWEWWRVEKGLITDRTELGEYFRLNPQVDCENTWDEDGWWLYCVGTPEELRAKLIAAGYTEKQDIEDLYR